MIARHSCPKLAGRPHTLRKKQQQPAAHLGLAALNGAGRLVQAAGQAVMGQRLLHHHLLSVRERKGGVLAN